MGGGSCFLTPSQRFRLYPQGETGTIHVITTRSLVTVPVPDGDFAQFLVWRVFVENEVDMNQESRKYL